MKITLFILSCVLVSIMIAEKILFFSQEPGFSSTLVAQIELLVLGLLYFFGIVSYFKTTKPTEKSLNKKKKLTTLNKSSKNISKVLLALTVCILSFSFFLNFSKVALDWDDVALYDARAKFISQGVALSEMPQLSEFDFKNSYYYLLYPPFTSELHATWYILGVPLGISLLYATLLVVTTLGVFLCLQPHVGTTGALAVSLLTISQEHLFSTSLVAYTNLPYTLFVSLGVLLLYNYFKSNQSWQLIFGFLLVATSQWIRFLEPTWLAVVLAFGITSYFQFSRKKAALLFVFFTSLCLFEYKIWQFFVYSIANNETIFQTSLTNFIEPVLGVFTGSFFTLGIFFVLAWGTPLIIHVSALLSGLSLKKPFYKTAELFLKLCIFFCIGMYFAGLYFISFQVEWWGEMGGSLVRSSTFLLPLSIYLLITEVQTYLRKK